MFLAVGETHGNRTKQKRTSSNNLFHSPPARRRREKELKRLGEPRCISPRNNAPLKTFFAVGNVSGSRAIARNRESGSLQKLRNVESQLEQLDRGCISRKRKNASCARDPRSFSTSSFCYQHFATFCSPDGECVIPFASRTPLPSSINDAHANFFVMVIDLLHSGTPSR